MTIEESTLKGLCILTPDLKRDDRGAFMEVFRMDELEKAGICPQFVQMNHSTSKKNVLRGLHFQWEKPLGKFIRVLHGTAFMAAIDIRRSSVTLGTWLGIEISAEHHKALWVPPGFATGFCTIGDEVQVEYCYTALYNPHAESTICWNDPKVGIRWPILHPILSPRDSAAGTFDDWMAKSESTLFP